MSQRWLRVLIFACIAGAAARGIAAAQAGGAAPERLDAPGLITTSFVVPAGTIRVNLPDDIAAGDTISGTVVAEPAGRTAAERDPNASELQGYVIDAGANGTSGNAQRTTVAPRAVLTFVVPADAMYTYLWLRDAHGQIVSRFSLNVRAAQPVLGRPPQPQDFRFPQVAVAGQPLQIHGPFGGVLANTVLAIGGLPAVTLAESPRTLVAAPAPSVVGPAGYRLTENGVAVAAPCTVLSLKLSAPKTNLRRGERTSVHVAIEGLTGIREPITLKLVNQTPGVIALAGGALQVLTVRPGDGGSNGSYATERAVTGLGSGSFSISATLDDRNPPAFVTGTPP